MDKNYKQYLPKINFTLEVLLEGLRSTNLRIDNISGGGGGSQDLQSVMTAGSLYFDPPNTKGFSLQGLEGAEQLNIIAGRSQLTVGKNGFGILAGKNFITPSSEFVELIADVKEGKQLIFSLPTDTKPTGQYTLATLDDILNINLDSRVYANNAAAITGGLVAKDLYRTITGELRIVV